MKYCNPLLILLVFLFINQGCRNSLKNHSKDSEKPFPDAQTENLKLPEIKPGTTPDTFRIHVEQEISQIEELVQDAVLLEKTVTLYEVPGTEVKIWYTKAGQPLKLVHGVTNDAGEFTNAFKYYFINGQLWYSDQIFARYIFQGETLLYWLDEGWKINPATGPDLKNRGQHIQGIVSFLLKDE